MNNLLNNLETAKKNHSANPFIVGISGIDGSGKGYIANYLQEELIKKGYSVHIENLDQWLNLPQIRFSNTTPANTFYQKGFRLDELIQKVLLPYKNNKNIETEANYLEETWTSFQNRSIKIEQSDFFILEGIFIFQDKINPFLDYKIWIHCSFETALDRAIQRNQEGLTQEGIKDSYHSRFFPAQELHFEIDNPMEKADIIYDNDFESKSM